MNNTERYKAYAKAIGKKDKLKQSNTKSILKKLKELKNVKETN